MIPMGEVCVMSTPSSSEEMTDNAREWVIDELVAELGEWSFTELLLLLAAMKKSRLG